MKIKTSELDDVALSWAVHAAEGVKFAPGTDIRHRMLVESYTRDWSRVGPIIERERINLRDDGGDGWCADDSIHAAYRGFTPLIAAMRCYVASKLGDEVEIPEELK